MADQMPLILTIDDEKVIRQSISNFLEDFDFNVIQAENGRVGLEVFEQKKPDLVLVDLRMPEVDGLDVLAKISKDSPDTPIIVVSGTGMITDTIEALHLGAWDYILKPVEDMSILLHSVNKALERAKLIRDNRSYQCNLEQRVEEKTVALQLQLNEHGKLLKAIALKNEELESIVYTASHDLRSPLVNIQGFSTELARSCEIIAPLIRDLEMPAETRKIIDEAIDEDIPVSLDFIRSSAAKMDQLMKALLRLSRLGKASLEIQSQDMNTIIHGIVRNMQHRISQQNVKVEIGNLPPCLADMSQINQVFTNLIDNAIKYLDPERPGVLTVTGRLEDGNAIYDVEDNGIGIAPHHQKNVFEIFHRLDPDGPVDGEGIGLTIVRRIIDRHNGSITVESEVDKGTKFTVILPAG
jgi:signal transduction histidine kinase